MVMLRMDQMPQSSVNCPPLSIWPHLFRGAGHEKRKGEQLKWSLAFRLYIESFLYA